MFVYGTLKKGFFPHYVLTGHETSDCLGTVRTLARFCGLVRTEESFKLVVGGKYNVPFLLNMDRDTSHVEGELYLVVDVKMERLDEPEGAAALSAMAEHSLAAVKSGYHQSPPRFK